MPTIFVDQEWGRRLEKAKRDIGEYTGIRNPTYSQCLDWLIHRKLPKGRPTEPVS